MRHRLVSGALAGTFGAQGGIAGVLEPEDRVEDHVADTLVAGGDQRIRPMKTKQPGRAGAAIAISPKAFDLLTLLLQERPKVVSKDILQQHLWPATFVAEANLSNLVAEIRGALGDNARSPRFIRTAHGFGYAFCGKATTLSGREAAASDRPCCWIEWDARRFPLHAGEHFIGRDPDVGVRLDASTVSRRHARLTFQGGKYVLEDLGSTNGTFVNGQRLAGPRVLKAGEVVSFGEQIILVFEVTSVDAGATMVSPRATVVPSVSRPVMAPPPPPAEYAGSVPASPAPAAAAPASSGNKTNITTLVIIGVVVFLVICCCISVFVWVDADPTGGRWCTFPFSIIARVLGSSCP